jgi:hypothetical protein
MFDSDGSVRGDIGPDDIVQFMHRTVKDFLLNPAGSGPLHFSEEMATQQVMLTAKGYLQLAFPRREPRYGPQISQWKDEKWSKNISEYVRYLDNRILLQFCISILSRHSSDRPLELGYLSQANKFVLGSGLFTFPVVIQGLYPEFKSLSRSATMESKIRCSNAIALGEFFSYACANGLIVATQNLLEVCKTFQGDYSQETLFAMGNGALQAAIRHDLSSEVRSLTSGNRHQSRLLATMDGWPIGKNGHRKRLDPFIQLAARCGSVGVTSYLFEHTDHYYARDSAVREFAVTQVDLDFEESLPEWRDEDSAKSSVRSFDLIDLGLLDMPGQNNDSQLPYMDPKAKEHWDSFRLDRRRDIENDQYQSSVGDVAVRDRRRERDREQREFWKLRDTCMEFALNVHSTARARTRLANHDMDDIKECLRLVIATCVRCHADISKIRPANIT